MSDSWESRRLGLAGASALVVANMVGAGVFTTSGFALADLGDAAWVLLAWLVGGGVALCGALAYGGIAQRIPRSGGEYTFLTRLHPGLGFAAGWVSLWAGFTGPIAVSALALEVYLGAALGVAAPPGWTATAAIAVALVLHTVRTETGTTSLGAVVLLKLVALAAFLFWASGALDASRVEVLPARAFDLGAFAVTLVWISFSYSGWNGAVYLAGEIRAPERTLRPALWIPTLGVALLYVALNAVMLWAAPAEQLAGQAEVGAIAAGALGGETARRWVSAVVCLALFSSVSVMVLSGPRVVAVMARDGFLPTALARGMASPRAALLAQAIAATALVWISTLRSLIGSLGFMLGISAAATVASAAYLRHREGGQSVPIPGYPWTPALFIGFTVGSTAFLVVRAPGDAAIGLVLLATGLPIYLWRTRQSS